MYKHFGVVIVGSILTYIVLMNKESIELETPFGRIKGYASSSRDSGQFWEFKGIPYAQPPVGILRFQPPLSFKSWDGTFDAKTLATPCAQYDNFLKRHAGNEDCLQLNIFTPKTPRDQDGNELLPVMVYIHGGSFLYGNSHFYGPDYFMDIQGFLNTGDDTIMGNMGLKDQVEALKWVQKGISSFGGDPSRVTIFGESAGGASVHYLMLSNQTKGLFHGAISQSGTALSPWAFAHNPGEQAVRVGNKLGCPTESSQQLLKCLQNMDTFKLADYHRIEEEFWSEAYGPSIEDPKLANNRKTALLLESPLKLASDGNYHKVPWILGANSHEGCILASVALQHSEMINRDWKEIYPLLFIRFQDKITKTKTLETIRQKYFGIENTNFSTSDLNTFTSLFSARHFYLPLQSSARYHQNHSNQPLFLYYFSYPGRTDGTEIGIGHLVRALHLPFVPIEFSVGLELLRVWLMDLFKFPPVSYGTCHADDLKYLFKQNPLLQISQTSQNYEFSKKLVHTWTQFAKHRIPDQNWRPVDTSRNLSFYELSGLIPKMIENPFEEQEMNFWQSLNLPRNVESDLNKSIPNLQ